mmetsp:Transcript_10425/g.38733  ORF Transcript_10425/g.38733 Transcript_10425/m.38733 type:complete len:518 (-) Transcript_10425:376-1929(-)
MHPIVKSHLRHVSIDDDLPCRCPNHTTKLTVLCATSLSFLPHLAHNPPLQPTLLLARIFLPNLRFQTRIYSSFIMSSYNANTKSPHSDAPAFHLPIPVNKLVKACQCESHSRDVDIYAIGRELLLRERNVLSGSNGPSKNSSFRATKSEAATGKSQHVSLAYMIDTLGRNSSLAQSLPHIITTSAKFERNSEAQMIYLGVVKDEEKTVQQSGTQSPKSTSSSIQKHAVALLKTGLKHLFFRDQFGAYHETDALCVLDFYVHEDFQRRGIGKMLFETMIERVNRELKEESEKARESQEKLLSGGNSRRLAIAQRGLASLSLSHQSDSKALLSVFPHLTDSTACQIQAHHLAYDRPSPKLLGFLKKHYSLEKFTPQANNYVVFGEYFEALTGKGPSKRQSVSQRPLSSHLSSSPTAPKRLLPTSDSTSVSTIGTRHQKGGVQTYDPITNQVRDLPNTAGGKDSKSQKDDESSPSSSTAVLTSTAVPSVDSLPMSKLSISSPQKAARMMRDFYNTRPRPF